MIRQFFINTFASMPLNCVCWLLLKPVKTYKPISICIITCSSLPTKTTFSRANVPGSPPPEIVGVSFNTIFLIIIASIFILFLWIRLIKIMKYPRLNLNQEFKKNRCFFSKTIRHLSIGILSSPLQIIYYIRSVTPTACYTVFVACFLIYDQYWMSKTHLIAGILKSSFEITTTIWAFIYFPINNDNVYRWDLLRHVLDISYLFSP